MDSDGDLRDFLLVELERTRRAYDEARSALVLALGSPSGIPGPGGITSITNTAKTHRAALEAYMRALREFHDFSVQGKIQIV
jgi:hypothetical protein